jgi:hypothetical protein
MRGTLAVLLTVLLFVLELPARTNRDWTKVETLKPGSAVLVMLWSGEDLTALAARPTRRWFSRSPEQSAPRAPSIAQTSGESSASADQACQTRGSG